ncbi:hypothetical protein [uncultured Microscilla sp.]|uniref:hypothetical protein n=1 Tax=uncultured Microscilla sp. TaxID=432653 RepID=UPI002604D284|nr:hypothetical protein [uncultured Microscilla sp.]
MKKLFVWSLLLLTFAQLIACVPQEEIFTNNPVTLGFSDKAIVFDTLFTNTRSITQRLRVYNPDKNAIRINRIEIGGKANSPYSVSIKGEKGTVFTDVELLGKDSLLVLVEITVPANSQTGVVIAFDSLLFTTNQQQQQVKLIAWSENAHVLQNYTITGNETWDKTKPYIIQDSVTVAAGATLTIGDSTRVYGLDKNAFIRVEGNLIVKGDTGSIVTFTGIRREIEFEEQLGQWRGIVMEAGAGVDISHALIKNAYTGIAITGNDADTAPDLIVKNTTIKNMFEHGINANNADVLLENSLITNCIGNTFGVTNGGSYILRHCTLTNYEFEFIRETPSVLFSNEAANPFTVELTNNILWGNKTNEVALIEPLGNIKLTARYNIVKTDLEVFEGNNNLLNQDPEFVKENIGDFNLTKDSPAKDAALPIGFMFDLIKIARDAAPDIGALEFVE